MQASCPAGQEKVYYKIQTFVDKGKSGEVVCICPMMRIIFRLLCILVILLACTGCDRRNASSIISRNYQFSVAIGKMEDQIDLIQLPGTPFSQSIDIEMQNGLFFISNGASKKVMEFSSYGDLLTLLYNAKANPQPVLLSEAKSEGAVSNRNAHPYPFSEVGEIAIADSGLLYIQDVVAEDRRIWDEELGTQLRNVVLRFSPEGSFLDYIGQEGVSGTPFPFIDSVSIADGETLNVVCRTVTDWILFSYDSGGELRHHFSFTETDLPVQEEGTITSIARVMPGSESDRLYVKTDYYSSEAENPDYRFDKSAIHFINTAGGTVVGTIFLPPAYKTSGRAQLFNREEEEVIQYLVGVGDGGMFFLLSSAGDKLYNLQIVDTTGMVVHKGMIELDDSETVFRKFYVTPEGILSALIGKNTEVDIVLWRTDRFIDGEL